MIVELKQWENLFSRSWKNKTIKGLQNTIGSMLKGGREYIMIDEQKVAYEGGINYDQGIISYGAV